MVFIFNFNIDAGGVQTGKDIFYGYIIGYSQL